MKTILITRPAPAGKALCAAINASGNKAIYFPSINIHPLKISHLPTNADIVIFTSPNAVIHAKMLLPTLANAKIAAIGAGTSLALKQHNINTDICPIDNFNSEGLLALFAMQNINKRNILIIKGAGGRPLLEETLRARGADVSSLLVYERQLPNIAKDALGKLLRENRLDIIVCTSCECLINLTKLTNAADLALLTAQQLLVSSQRIVDTAKRLHFQHKPILTKNAQSETILATLLSE